MTTITIPPEALEAAARAICEAENGPCECLPDECGCTYWQAHARAAIAVALEEAAKVCDEIETAEHRKWKQHADMMAQGASDGAGDCAAAIRALKEKDCDD